MGGCRGFRCTKLVNFRHDAFFLSQNHFSKTSPLRLKILSASCNLIFPPAHESLENGRGRERLVDVDAIRRFPRRRRAHHPILARLQCLPQVIPTVCQGGTPGIRILRWASLCHCTRPCCPERAQKPNVLGSPALRTYSRFHYQGFVIFRLRSGPLLTA